MRWRRAVRLSRQGSTSEHMDNNPIPPRQAADSRARSRPVFFAFTEEQRATLRSGEEDAIRALARELVERMLRAVRRDEAPPDD